MIDEQIDALWLRAERTGLGYMATYLRAREFARLLLATHAGAAAEPVAYRYKIGRSYEYRPMKLTHYFWDDVNERYIQGEPLYTAAALTSAPAEPKRGLTVQEALARSTTTRYVDGADQGQTTMAPAEPPPAAGAIDARGQDYPELPKPYSNIYPEDPEECCHHICYTPSTQPGGGRPNHQPVFTADQMHAYASEARKNHDEKRTAEDDSSPAKNATLDAGATGTACGHGANQHYQHRTGQTDDQRTSAERDCRRAGVSRESEVREVAIAASRVIEAWESSPLRSNDGMLFERIEDLRAALASPPEAPAAAGAALAVAPGIYVASRASVPERPAMWQGLRLKGWPITSTWIDEAGEGETESYAELWQRIHDEIAGSVGVLLYAEADDFPLKGALIECGIALGMGKPVAFVLPNVALAPRSMKPIGSWAAHPNARRFDDLESAKAWLLAATPAPEKKGGA